VSESSSLLIFLVAGRATGHATGPSTEEWEKELEAELQDYEMVADSDGHATSGGSATAAAGATSASNWEHQIEDMLDEDLDLK